MTRYELLLERGQWVEIPAKKMLVRYEDEDGYHVCFQWEDVDEFGRTIEDEEAPV